MNDPSESDEEILGMLELCELALDNESGVIAVLKAYIDESGIHDDTQICTVGAYLGRPADWAAWLQKWKVNKRPIKVYHSTDSQNLQGEFKGWTPDARDALSKKVLPVLAKSNIVGLAIGVDVRAFKEATENRPVIRELFGTPYASCFQWLVQMIMLFALKAGSSERIGFYHETNDFKEEALKGFDWVEKHGNPNNTWISLSFGGKNRFPALQAADVLAYEANRRLRDPGRPERRSWVAIDPDKTRIQCWAYHKGNIDELVSRLEAVAKGQFVSVGPGQSWKRYFPDLPDDWASRFYRG